MRDSELAIGVDLGGTKIATALVNRDGDALEVRQIATGAADGATAVCDRIAAEIRAVSEAWASRPSARAGRPSHVAGIGIGTPGIVASDEGVVRRAVNLRWNEVHLAGEISNRLDGMPVFVENDANANALGEGMFGAARGCRDYILLTIGSGLGAGVVSGGRLIVGRNGIAADLGHYSIDPDHGRECICGQRGCAETVVSGPGLVVTAQELLRNRSDLTPELILNLARQGDAMALTAINLLARWLGYIAAVAAAVTNPELILIGGGLGTAAFDLIHNKADEQMRRRLPPTYAPAVQLKVATLSNPSVGAASLVFARQGICQENAG
jgi:glucokinase